MSDPAVPPEPAEAADPTEAPEPAAPVDASEQSDVPVVQRADPAVALARVGVGRLARHVFLCAGPSCCEAEEGARVWGHLKRRLAELRLTGSRDEGPCVFRTRVGCLQACNRGPIMLVYPEGAWYQDVTVEAAERIIQEHVLGGRVVEDLCFARDRLGPLEGELEHSDEAGP